MSGGPTLTMATQESPSTVLSRKRTRRACDKCSTSRARCDGQCPCRRCLEYGHPCLYDRDPRKRGRKPGPRKPLGIQVSGITHHLNEELSPGSVLEDTPGPEPPERPDASIESEHGQILEDLLDSRREQHVQPSVQASGYHAAPSPAEACSTGGPVQHVTSPLLTVNARTVDSQSGRGSFSETPLTNQLVRDQGHVNPEQPPVTPPRPYKCLEPILPLLVGIIDVDESCELLEFYFAQPGRSLFRSASPYTLTHVLRKRSLLHPTSPRPTTPALLCTMLWVSAQTADIPLLLLPGERTTVCEALRKLCMRLIQKRDRDHWERTPGGKLVEDNIYMFNQTTTEIRSPPPSEVDPYVPLIDDVLTFILVCIVISGGDFKTDCQVWWNKAVRLMYIMGLNRKDRTCDGSGTNCVTASCTCRRRSATSQSLESLEVQEECRRVFWLLFCLDRHLALSYNSTLCIGDDECEVFTPLPEDVWNSFESAPFELLTTRSYGPPTLVTGTGLFEWVLPLMAILGDVIQVHHRKLHPRFGALDDGDAVSLVETSLTSCARSIRDVESRYETEGLDGTIPASEFLSPSSGYQDTPWTPSFDATASQLRGRAQAQLVTAYGTFILHVLHVLLHGKWDAVSMLENDDGWITSVHFMKCASHAISASEAVSQILRCDPELTFMPYLFGIYLLHGSFILLLFADRMPQLGPNDSVERACETIIRAHEVCVVTLSTEFQKRFRKVLRSTLYSVRSTGATNAEESKARRRALSLYRWTKGSRGLAL